MRRIVITSTFAAVTFLFGSQAFAHAFLDHASPPVGGTVKSAPRALTLSFTEKLEPSFSTVEVTGPSGARIDRSKARISGNTMQVDIKSGGPGTYHVHWHALSVDTHTTQGSYTFHVGGS